MSGGNEGRGRTHPAGPPQARNLREHRASSIVTDHERQKVPAISLEESPDSAKSADGNLTDPPGSGSVQSDSAGDDRWKEAAALLGSVAKMITSDSARSEIGRSARADLVRKLDALEWKLLNRVDAGSQPRKATPP